MKIIKTEDFISSFERLPSPIRQLFLQQEKRFLINSNDPRLHVKKVKDLSHAFSFRITRRYRTLFYFLDHDTAVFFEIDHRKDVYR